MSDIKAKVALIVGATPENIMLAGPTVKDAPHHASVPGFVYTGFPGRCHMPPNRAPYVYMWQPTTNATLANINVRLTITYTPEPVAQINGTNVAAWYQAYVGMKKAREQRGSYPEAPLALQTTGSPIGTINLADLETRSGTNPV